jgi:hypothetical protein
VQEAKVAIFAQARRSYAQIIEEITELNRGTLMHPAREEMPPRSPDVFLVQQFV